MAKGNISKMKREPTVWENIFANDTTDKGLISITYKELTQLHSRKTNNPIKKGLEQTLLQGGHTEGPETYEKMLSITSRQRDAIKTTMRYHVTSVTMALITKSTKCWRGCGENQTLVHCWRECRLVQSLWKTVWNFLKNLRWSAFWPSNSTVGIIL